MPTPDERIATLVRLGFMPTEAERIVNEAEAHGPELYTADELAALDTQDMGIEATRLWWWYSPDVPQEFKRLLEAADANA